MKHANKAGVTKKCYADLVRFGLRNTQKAFSKGLLTLALVPLLPWSCQRPPAPSSPVAAPPPNYLDLGDRSFMAGDYPAAVEAYRVYLRDTEAPNRDRAVFHLALVYALPASPLNDPLKADVLLRELRVSYPQSPLRPQADLLLELNEEAEELRSQLQAETERLRSEVALRDERIGVLSQEVEKLQQGQEIDKLRAELAQREEKIRQLTEELDKLKQIDMQRRPATPPR